jgi:predicted lipoprotein with Yx(FWY)xxD motif
MRKSGWAAVAGLGSLALLLTACGGSSSTTTSGSGSTPTTSTQATAGKPSSNPELPQPGTTILIVEKSKLGYVLALAKNGIVVYTYSGDKKGSPSTCTGSCATQWPAVTGMPQASSAVTLPGTLGTVATASGAKQVTYNGMPLYTFKGSKPFAVTGNGGSWHVVKMSKSDIKAGG